MKKLYMLDTDIASYVIRGTYPALNTRISAHKNHLCISSITLAELLFGVTKRKSARLSDAVMMFQQLVEVKNWTVECAEHYGLIRSALETSGGLIGNMDMLIAASAIAEKATLITNNTAHFSRIPGLEIENWTA